MSNVAPFKTHVGSSRGAQMGRRSFPLSPDGTEYHLVRVPFVDGDYDPGGAYWGGYPSDPLFCAWAYDCDAVLDKREAEGDLPMFSDPKGVTHGPHYIRAKSRTAAKAQFPGIKFLR